MSSDPAIPAATMTGTIRGEARRVSSRAPTSASGPPTEPAGAEAAGTVIGRTRLIGNHGHAQAGGAVRSRAAHENGKRKDRVIRSEGRRDRAGGGMGGGGEGARPRRLPAGLRRHELGRPRPQPTRQPRASATSPSRARSTPSSPTTRSSAASICSTAANRTSCGWAAACARRPPSSSRTISSASAGPRCASSPAAARTSPGPTRSRAHEHRARECRPSHHRGALGAGGRLSAVAGRGARGRGRERRPARGARRWHGRTHGRRHRRTDRLLDVRQASPPPQPSRPAAATALQASNEALAQASRRTRRCAAWAARWLPPGWTRRDPLGERRRFAAAALPLPRCHPPQCRPLAGLVPGRAGRARIAFASEAAEPQPQRATLGADRLEDRTRRPARRAPGAAAGDWIVLASDGICSLEGDEIADIVYNYRQSTPEEMADGLIAAVVQKNVAGQDNTTVVAIRVDPAKVATDADTTRVLRGRGKEEKELRSRRIGMTGRKTSIPGRPPGRPARTAIWFVAAAVFFLFFAAAILLRSLQSTTITTSPETTTSTPPAPVAAPAPEPATPDAPDTTGPDAPRQRIPAGPAPTPPDAPQTTVPESQTPPVPQRVAPPTPQKSAPAPAKATPPIQQATPVPPPPTAPADSQAVPAVPPPSQAPSSQSGEGQEGAPRTEKMRRQGKDGEKPWRKPREAKEGSKDGPKKVPPKDVLPWGFSND